MRDKTRECDTIPGFKHNSLVSVGKLADAGYYTLCMSGGKEIQVCNSNEVEVNISAEAML